MVVLIGLSFSLAVAAPNYTTKASEAVEKAVALVKQG